MEVIDIVLRVIEPEEQPQAVRLWQSVFGAMPGYFERYYNGDPFYQPGDTLGAWDGNQLVSAVHLCRRPVVWGADSLLCGGIANVATLPDFRRQGLSRQLLTLIIAKMERERFDFSLLGTGVVGHYAALGWELTHAPRAVITLHSLPASHTPLDPLLDTTRREELYTDIPRLLQFQRPYAYFDHWVRWNWNQEGARLLAGPSGGYLALVIPEDTAHIPFLSEWRAADAAGELTLFQAAADEALALGRPQLGLEGVPQHLNLESLEALGPVTLNIDESSMIRRIGVPHSAYEEVKDAYQSGRAVWWPNDGF